MSTRNALAFTRAAFFSLALAAVATPALAVQAATPTIDLQSGGHLRVVSAYLTKAPIATVRGFVRRDPLWSGQVNGHLHVTGYAADGQVLAFRAAAWSGHFTENHSTAHIYQVALDVPRADVARIAVAYAPGQHASEVSQ